MALYVALDVAVWALVVWMVMGTPPMTARSWHGAMRLCRTMATGWGELAIVCEDRYWSAVGYR